MKRIHIVGCGPRSGTTLMYEMMIACFEINHYTKHESRIYRWPSQKADIFLTKTPRDVMLAEASLKVMKNLFVIYMIRDPRDMIVSQHKKDPGTYWAGLKYWKTYTLEGEKLKNHPRVITIKYEDLVQQPDHIQQEISSRFSFLKQKTTFSNYHQNANPSIEALNALGSVRKVNSQNIGNWRNHKARIVSQIKTHGSISDDLIEYGYEPDKTWEQELKGIAPDNIKSHFPEKFSKQEIRKLSRYKYLKALWAYIGHFQVFWFSKEFVKKILIRS